MPRFYIIAGEASGDLHASSLMRELLIKYPDAVFRGFGGDKMKEAGCQLTYHYRDIAFMGIKEVLVNYKIIKNALNACKKDIITFHPDAVILVDYPGFNLRIARFAKRNHFKTIYYISPQLWAWKEKRVKKIKQHVDLMLCILPFEIPFYNKHNYKAVYVGHPLVERIKAFKPDAGFKETNKLDNRPVIALLPGSRVQEVKHILPAMIQVTDHFPHYQFVVGAASSVDTELYLKICKGKNVKIVTDNSYNLMHFARAALITSGTAVTEASLFQLPLVVCYNTSWTTYQIFKRLARIKYISIINLVFDQKVVDELIQQELNVGNIKDSLNKLLQDGADAEKLKLKYREFASVLGDGSASVQAAEQIDAYLHKSF